MLATPLSPKVILQQPFHSSAATKSVKPKHYKFCLTMIGMALDMSRLGASNRLIPKLIGALQRYCTDLLELPSYGTVRNWVAIQSLFYLDPANQSGDAHAPWCIIADLSITIGGQRLLLILGVDLNKYDHSQPLEIGDIQVLGLASRTLKGWTAEDVAAYLRNHILSHYSVLYMVSDAGPNLVKAAKILDLPRVSDVSHAVALDLKLAYNQLPDFERFTRKCAHLRRYNSINDFVPLRPPRLRDKARFMNISYLIDWAYDMLQILEGRYDQKYLKGEPLSDTHRHKLSWLLEFKDMIYKMYAEMKLINNLIRGLKMEGVSEQTVQWAKSHLQGNHARQCMQPRVRLGLLNYLDEQLLVTKQVNLAQVICSTDILESCFGYYKQSSPGTRMYTRQPLRIACYGRPLVRAEQVKLMMESRRIIDVEMAMKHEGYMKITSPHQITTQTTLKPDGESHKGDNQTFLSP